MSDSLRDYYKKELDKYFKEYSKQSMLTARMTGTIQAFLKHSSLPASEKKMLADGIIWAYESSELSLGSSQELFEKFSKQK